MGQPMSGNIYIELMDKKQFPYPTPASPQEWYEAGVAFRRNEMFGEAINAFREAERLAECAIAGRMSDGSGASVPAVPDLEVLERLRARAVASIELIQSIRGFVNRDLMNP